MTMMVAQIHRFPVKSMLGERLEAVEIDDRGLVGDRAWAVRDEDGKLASGKNTRRFRRMDPVFQWTASLGPDGVPVISLPDGTSIAASDPGAHEVVSDHVGHRVHLVREGSTSHMDGGCVSLIGSATLRAVAEMLGEAEPLDPRRFRANLVIETDDPYVEDSWVGRMVAVGAVVLRVVRPIERCRTVDIRQGEVPRHGRILKTLGTRRDLLLAMYADPVDTGVVHLGDGVTVR